MSRELSSPALRKAFFDGSYRPGDYYPGWPPQRIVDGHTSSARLVVGVAASPSGWPLARWFQFRKRRVLGVMKDFSRPGSNPFCYLWGKSYDPLLAEDGSPVYRRVHAAPRKGQPSSMISIPEDDRSKEFFQCAADIVALPTLDGSPRQIAKVLEDQLPVLHAGMARIINNARKRFWCLDDSTFEYRLVLARAALWFDLTNHKAPKTLLEPHPRVIGALTHLKVRGEARQREVAEIAARLLRGRYGAGPVRVLGRNTQEAK